MNRLKPHPMLSFNNIWHILTLLFVLFILYFFLRGVQNVDDTTMQEQTKSLENAVRRSVVQCYVVEGTYPPSLNYLEEHYGLTYDPEQYYIDYISIGSNLMPDITIIPLSE